MACFHSAFGFYFLISLLGFQEAFAGSLSIVSPHRKSIQNEFVPAFKEYYLKNFKEEVDVEWIDQGGTSDDVRFLRSRFEQNPASAGVDLFWGGGQSVFSELSSEGYLQSFNISESLGLEVPEKLGGVQIYDKERTWYSQALSAFGIFFNRKLIQSQKIKEPKSWSDLGNPEFQNHVSQADPRRSGTAGIMNMIILQAYGWEKGWEVLFRMAGNTRMFTHSSSDPVKAIVSGDAYAAPVADFYAYPKIGELGANNLGFEIPVKETILNGDPIAILKGAPNLVVAQRFVEFSLSKDAQKLWLLAVGAPGGPKQSYLGRIAVNRLAYEETEGQRVETFNPFSAPDFFELDFKKSADTLDILNDLMGAVIIDHHSELRSTWRAILSSKEGLSESALKVFSEIPLSEADFLSYAKKWKDQEFRNVTLNKWSQAAKEKFTKIQNSFENKSEKRGIVSWIKGFFKG